MKPDGEPRVSEEGRYGRVVGPSRSPLRRSTLGNGRWCDVFNGDQHAVFLIERNCGEYMSIRPMVIEHSWTGVARMFPGCSG